MTNQKPPIQALNPFMPGAGLQPPALVGRQDDIDALDRMAARTKLHLMDQGIVFSGLRGMGKTVLLIALQKIVANQGMLTARIEATGNYDRDYDTLIRETSMIAARAKSAKLRNAVARIISEVDSITLKIFDVSATFKTSEGNHTRSELFRLELMLEKIADEAQKDSKGLFLFIDELQEMHPEMLGSLITLQHKMGQESVPFYIIGAGLPNLPGTLSKTRSYAERLFEYRKIGKLSEQDTAEGFQKPVRANGRPFDEEALSRLVSLSQGYPYFIQAYGKAAWNASSSNPIGMDAVEAGIPEARAELDDGLYASRWQKAKTEGRRYMYAMAQMEGDEPCRSADVAEHLGKKPKELSMTRRDLIESGLVFSPEQGMIAFTVPGMGEFVRRTCPTPEQLYDTANSEASEK